LFNADRAQSDDEVAWDNDEGDDDDNGSRAAPEVSGTAPGDDVSKELEGEGVMVLLTDLP
jgi:hypothetical protein